MCDCIERVNEGLRSRAIKVSQNIILNTRAGRIDAAPVIIETINIYTGKPSRIPLFATHCPFCGEKYPPIGDDK